MSTHTHPRGEAPYGMSRLLLGGTPSQDLVATGSDMRTHRVFAYRRLENGVIEWAASCGYRDYTTGSLRRGLEGSSTMMLCKAPECFQNVR